MNKQEFFAHFPQKISQELVDYVNNVALLKSRYLFVSRVGGIQFAYCTHCQQQYTPNYLYGTLKHNENCKCEKCGSQCVVKASGRGRSRLIDDAYVVWYGKSEINPSALIARGIYVKRDYTGDFKKVQTEFCVMAEYLFIPSNSNSTRKEQFGKSWLYREWRISTSIVSELDNHMKRPPFFMSVQNVKEAVKGTPFEYSQWQTFLTFREEDEWVGGWYGRMRPAGEPRTDLVKFFDLAARYPCTEYLAKMGFHELIWAKMNGSYTYNTVNWRGTTMEKVLRLSKQEIKELRATGLEITPLLLHSYHFHRKKDFPLTFEQAYQLQDLTFDSNRDLLKAINAPHPQAMRYVLKQLARPDAKKWYSSATSVLQDWRDYLEDCKKLGMNLESEAVLYPNDLHKAHQKTVEKVKYKEDKALNIKIASRLQGLIKKYAFEHAGLMIRPAVDTVELFREGKELSHCVGRYAKDYAEGKTDLLFVRRVSEPETPFYTLEVKNERVVQCRGLKNCNMTPEVREFVNAFIEEKLQKKKTRIKLTERQEVAV